MPSRFYLLKKPRFVDIQKTTLGLNRASRYEINYAKGRSNTRFIHTNEHSTTLATSSGMQQIKSATHYFKIGKKFFELKKVMMSRELVIVDRTGVKGTLGNKFFIIDKDREFQ